MNLVTDPPGLAAFLDMAGDAQIPTEELLNDVRTGRRQAWGGMHAGVTCFVILTALVEQKDGCICVITHAAGWGLKDAKQHMPALEAWAKAQGCKAIEWEGRFGFQRAMRDCGFKPRRVTMYKEI